MSSRAKDPIPERLASCGNDHRFDCRRGYRNKAPVSSPVASRKRRQTFRGKGSVPGRGNDEGLIGRSSVQQDKTQRPETRLSIETSERRCLDKAPKGSGTRQCRNAHHQGNVGLGSRTITITGRSIVNGTPERRISSSAASFARSYAVIGHGSSASVTT